MQHRPPQDFQMTHTCDKFQKGIREIFLPFQGGLSKMYKIKLRKLLNSDERDFQVLVKSGIFRRNFRAHLVPWRSGRVHMHDDKSHYLPKIKMFDFFCSLFPKIVINPLDFRSCSLIPQNPWEGLPRTWIISNKWTKIILQTPCHNIVK